MPARKLVAEALLEHVADHPLALGAEDVERVRGNLPVGLALQRQEPDLRPVAMGDDDIGAARDLGDGPHGDGDIPPLRLRIGGLAPPQEGVAAKRDHDSCA